MSIHANVNPVFHGLGLQYNHGETPAVAITGLGRVVEVHRTEGAYRLFHRVGDLKEATIIWKQSILYGTGQTPHVAVNNHHVVVEVHKNEATGRTLYYSVGRLTDDRVDWGQPRRGGKPPPRRVHPEDAPPQSVRADDQPVVRRLRGVRPRHRRRPLPERRARHGERTTSGEEGTLTAPLRFITLVPKLHLGTPLSRKLSQPGPPATVQFSLGSEGLRRLRIARSF